jgi:hypothetical protein
LDKTWALEILVGQEGLLMNVTNASGLVKVCNFIRRGDDTAGPAETSGLIRSGDYITHLNREVVTGGVKQIAKLLANRSDPNGMLFHLFLHAPAGTEFPPTAKLEDSPLLVRDTCYYI